MSSSSSQLVKQDAPSQMWLKSSMLWIAVSAVFGIVHAVPYAVWMWGEGSLLSLPLGRIFWAVKGTFLYGWGMTALAGVALGMFPKVESFNRAWHKALLLVWNLGVAAGTVSILAGEGSGLAFLPFAWWVWPVLLLVLISLIVLISGCGHGRDDQGSGYAMIVVISAFSVIVASIGLTVWSCGAGTAGIMLAAGAKTAIPLCAAVVCLSASLKYHGKWGVSEKTALILLAAATVLCVPFAGLSAVSTWPVPWRWVQWGRVASWACYPLLMVVCAVAARVIARGGKRADFAWLMGGLSALFLGLAWKWTYSLADAGNGRGQFELMQWYASDLSVLLAVGLVGVPAYVCRVRDHCRRLVALWAVSCIVFLMFGFGTLSGGRIFSVLPSGQGEMWCKWVEIFSLMEILLWCLTAVAGVLMYRCLRRLLFVTAKSHGAISWKMPSLVLTLVTVVCSSVAYHAFAVNGHAGQVVPFASLRPGSSLKGSKIYAAEGCPICHSQIIRRQTAGYDLQRVISEGGQGDADYRVTEPQDYDPAMQESAPHIGLTRIGGDLFNLAARVEQYVTYRRQDGELDRTASPREWVLLHLYNPRDPVFGKPWTICPAMPHLFAKRKIRGAGRSAESLPVACEEGYEIVPTQRGLELASYLLSLKRTGMPGEMKDEALYAGGHWSHISPAYLAHPPVYDFSPLEEARTAWVMDRGRQIFLSKCSVCHGANGLGDQVNYPPLDGSEWLSGKPPEEIVHILRHGLEGPITVKGREWNSAMLPPGITGPEEAASLMTYLWRQFGKLEKPPVSRDDAEKWWRDAEEK